MGGCTDSTIGTREQLGETQEQPTSPLGSLLASLPRLWNPRVCTFLILIFSHGLMAPCFQLRFGHINNLRLQLDFPAHVSKSRVRWVELLHQRPSQRQRGRERKTIFHSITLIHYHNNSCDVNIFVLFKNLGLLTSEGHQWHYYCGCFVHM